MLPAAGCCLTGWCAGGCGLCSCSCARPALTQPWGKRVHVCLPKINQRCDGEVGAKASLRSAWVRSVRLGSPSPLTPLGVPGGTGVARE